MPPSSRQAFISWLFFPLLFVGIMPFLFWVSALDLISIVGKQRRCPHNYFCSSVVVTIN
jgi:hypothetical protein